MLAAFGALTLQALDCYRWRRTRRVWRDYNLGAREMGPEPVTIERNWVMPRTSIAHVSASRRAGAGKQKPKSANSTAVPVG